ncbi:MAG: 50S ribosomal protein L11 methyltransferase [Gammaproteobacteria bacterium]
MQQLIISNCTQAEIETLSDLLELCGALSITMTDQFDNPILEPEPGTVPLWPHIVMQALYEPDIDINSIITVITDQYPQAQCSVERVEEQDWERTCLKDFNPQCFGKRLWICPSWHTPPNPDAVNLILDPGLAFGTGSHATTALCLTWLEQTNLHNKTVIDYGCGSGILGIAALKLGAAHVYAVDIDAQALTATANNAETNHIAADSLTIDYPNTIHKPVDIIIANILLTPLLDLKHSLHNLLNPHGILTLSGILTNQIPLIEQAYQAYFNLISTEIEEDWALLSFEKKETSHLLLN